MDLTDSLILAAPTGYFILLVLKSWWCKEVRSAWSDWIHWGQHLKVLRKHPDKLSLVGVSTHTQAAKLHSIVEEFDVSNAHLGTIPSDLIEFPKTTNLGHSLEDLEALASLPEADLVVVAIVGSAGLRPT